ncbi:MAG: tetratricopeptide repeat protein [Thermoplasmata archaeon]
MISKIPEDVKNKIKMYVSSCISNKRYDDAIAALKEYLKDEPYNIEAMNLIATLSISQNNFDEANKWCNRVTRINPDYSPALYTRGTIECQKHHWEKAVENFEKAIKNFYDGTNEELAEAYQMLGVALWESRRKDEAIKAWKTCLKYNPNQIYAKKNLKEFTNEYGMPKSVSPIMDDFFAYLDIKNEEYLNLKHKEMLDDEEEATKVFKKIQQAWNRRIAPSRKFDKMNTIEKIELFKKIKISWDEIK